MIEVAVRHYSKRGTWQGIRVPIDELLLGPNRIQNPKPSEGGKTGPPPGPGPAPQGPIFAIADDRNVVVLPVFGFTPGTIVRRTSSHVSYRSCSMAAGSAP